MIAADAISYTTVGPSPLMALIQDYMGLETAIYLMAVLGTTPVGNLLAGEAAQALGVNGVRWVLAAQGVCLAAAAVWAARRHHGEQAQEVSP